MKRYSFSDLNRATGEILDEALKDPVTLTKRGKDRLVLIPIEMFQRLNGHLRSRAYLLDDLPPGVASDLDAALEQILAELSEDKP